MTAKSVRIISSRDLAGRDNPTHRLDVAYLQLVARLKDARVPVTDDDVAALRTLVGPVRWKAVRTVLETASAPEPMVAPLTDALGVDTPSDELRAGLRRVAERLFQGEVARLEGVIAAAGHRLRAMGQ